MKYLKSHVIILIYYTDTILRYKQLFYDTHKGMLGGKMKKLFILFIPFVFICCASTDISSFKNPDINFSDYKKILVYGNSRDIDFQKSIENFLVITFKENNIEAVSSIELIPPLKEYTEEDIQKILYENEIDGYLSVSVVSATEESVYIPQSSHTYYRSQYVNGSYSSIPYTMTSGGYSVTYPKASFDIILTDIKSGKIAFKATANSEGDEFSDMKTIAESLACAIVEEYIKLSSE